MNFTKIITFVLIAFVVILVITSYLSSDKSKITDDLKDSASDRLDNILDNNIVNKSTNTIDTVKSRISYGSFDRTIDTEVYFCPEDDCLEKLLSLIDSSKKSIDCAVYDISLLSVTDALISKAEEGVKIRFVSDYQRSEIKNSNLGLLKSSDVSVITNPSESSYMHNKFCVFDEKTVWVGSMNFTLNGNYKNNNNVLVLKDKELVKAYTQKIDSFFKGNFSQEITDVPQVKSFGNIENYFCPEDDCKYHLLRLIDDVNYSLDCMFFSFTLKDFFDIVVDKDIEQRYILEKTGVSEYSQYNNFKNNSIPVILDNNPNSMHHKFCVLDEYAVITGSMNISKNGTENNDESFVVVYNQEIAKEYKDYFNSYWDLWSAN
jgi:phosphatidylserine/phosphatidylglycerophosphate/cardiolipin synthase-like enzyme